MKKRLISLDMTKGIGIIIVMLMHCLSSPILRTITIYVFGSFMFIFFFITGYNYKPGKRSIRQSIKQRAKQIVIPFYLYSAVIIAISAIISIATGKQTPQDILYDTIKYYFGITTHNMEILLGPLWFLPTMFLSSVVFFFMVDFSLGSTKRMVLIILALTAISALTIGYTAAVPWRLPLVPVCAAVMLVGAYAGQKQFFANPPLKDTKLVLSVLGSVALYIVLTVLFGNTRLISTGILGKYGGWSVFTAFVIALVQIYAFIFGCELMSRSKTLAKIFGWFGVHSMQFLVTHLALAYYISSITGWPYGTREFPGGMGSVIMDLQNFALCLVMIGLIVCWLLAWDKIKENHRYYINS